MTLAAVAPSGRSTARSWPTPASWMDRFSPQHGQTRGCVLDGRVRRASVPLLQLQRPVGRRFHPRHEAGIRCTPCWPERASPLRPRSYAIFVAEIASTLNENLLVIGRSARLATTTNGWLAGQRLESLRNDSVQANMFAEFELGIHERAEKGEA